MSGPPRPDAVRPSARQPDADKEARIEQLLLDGLDEYFAGRYEHAINVWTRVVFLERGHNRARAYIERARSALAERHRESEELLHRGIAAFNSGQNDAARDLITRAVERGGPHDVALVLLERLNRLVTPPHTGDTVPRAHVEPRPALRRQPETRGHHSWRVRAAAGVALVVAAVAIAVLTGLMMPSWLADPPAEPSQPIAAAPFEPLPVARPSERLVSRARELQLGGHARDALRLLDQIDIADPLRPEADRLRGELQRRLLEAASTEALR